MLILGRRARIEARQAQCRGRGIEKTHQPSDSSPQRTVFGDARDAPLIGHDGRRDAEGHHVGEAVVFLAEGAFGVGPARHATVQTVEHHGHEYRHAGVIESPVNGGDDRVEAGEQCPGGEQVRQPVHPARRDVSRLTHACRHEPRRYWAAKGRACGHVRYAAMRLSQYPISTLRDVPADAEVISHQLMLRAGMIRRLAAGLYSWLPMGLRTLHKVERIVREEMNRAGALEAGACRPFSRPNCGRNPAAGASTARSY